MTEGRWQPVLSGERAAAAREAARAIATDLATAEVEDVDVPAVALFFAYAAGEWDDEAIETAYRVTVDRLVDQIAAEHVDLHLFGGLAGEGWVLAHIASDGAGEVLALIDDALMEQPVDAAGPYDLGEGLVGHGVYFVERLINEPSAARPRDALARIVAQLDRRAIVDGAGLVWATERDGARWFDCGVAHGIAGVIALLAKVIELGDPPPRTAELLAGSRAWLRATELPPSPVGRYPAKILPGVTRRPPPTRTAWCYGDPGTATALWSAAARTGDSIADAHALALEVAARAPAATRIVDAGVCHGALGLGHLLARCAAAAPGDATLRAAAAAWFERGLAFRDPGTGIGGFLSPPPGGQTGAWTASPDFLEGASGMGLALLGAATATEPSWDRYLLCDVPVAR